jgi:hypothetical protein
MKAKGAKPPKNQKPQTPRPRGETFPQIKGKVIESVEAAADEGELYVTISFNDKTRLYFDVSPDEPTFHVEAEYGSLKTGNFRSIKRWPRISTER